MDFSLLVLHVVCWQSLCDDFLIFAAVGDEIDLVFDTHLRLVV